MSDRAGAMPTPPRLGVRAAGGALVTMGGQGVRALVQFGGIILLARLLTPHDYGLVAMVTAIIGVAEILRDFGLSSATMQARTVSREQRDNLFWINAAIGLALAVAVFCGANAVARFYGEPALVGIAQALAATFLLNGLATQHRAQLGRELQFGRLAAGDVGGQVAGLAAAVAAALAGAGFWALVVQQVVQAAATLLLALLCGRWLPRGYRRDAPVGRFIGFGGSLAMTQLLGYASRNTGQVMIGLRMGADALGPFNRAFQLLMMPLNQISAPATTVALPVLSRLQDDPARFGAFLLRGQTVLVHLVAALLAWACAQALPLIVLLLGDQWLAAVRPFRWLALGGMFQVAGYACYWVFMAKGLAGAQLRCALVGRSVLVACVVAGAAWGVEGVAAGYALGLLLLWPLSLFWISRVSDAPALAMLGNGLRALAAYGACAALSTAASTWVAGSLWTQLLVGTAAMAGGFAVLVLAWPAFRRDVASIVQIRHLLAESRRHR
ncbi:lipopolysaccharide biosynthesis protein [Luteimonas kalidii]|uniref:Lipopolysaccharide biosynthesis protein n=1 Tax=Luteimonas kalidii TaxID=3042025 RepID=A0ABT6JYI6_9GAMM|nr:lipopolysaccharide biosynthesis protein [Luteimonas kalidii]MDH5835573.1 lipopolysaccharide biosynthesis protein [Luteimonas kalidii]